MKFMLVLKRRSDLFDAELPEEAPVPQASGADTAMFACRPRPEGATTRAGRYSIRRLVADCAPSR